MGMDSVELLMRLEEVFGKEVPDVEAENIATVEQMVDWFYKNLVIHSNTKSSKDQILDKVNQTFKSLGLTAYPIKETEVLYNVFPKSNLKSTWKSFGELMSCIMPKLQKADFMEKAPNDNKILGIRYRKTKSTFLSNNMERLIYCIGALNYMDFVNLDILTSRFDIEIVVMGVIVEQVGIEIDEIYLNSSFTSDLGID